jgi:hypothetical protein
MLWWKVRKRIGARLLNSENFIRSFGSINVPLG